MTNKLKLNHGCGAVRPEGWENTDSSLNALLQRIPVLGNMVPKIFKSVEYNSNNVKYVNLNKRWPYKDNSVDIVYASHLFEHLSAVSAELFLSESFRCLKPNGVVRIVVPDLYKIANRYIAEYNSNSMENPTEFIMWAINMHREGQYGNKISWVKKQVYEWQGYPHQHKFMYDEKSLAAKMRKHNFQDILSLTYGESQYIPEIKDVEGKKESYLSVYLEAKKPA